MTVDVPVTAVDLVLRKGHGERDILGLCAGDGSEGAEFWLSVLNDQENRGVEDVYVLVCDGRRGLPDSVTTTWPLTTVQACLLHSPTRRPPDEPALDTQRRS